jgi:hypothetical protein
MGRTPLQGTAFWPGARVRTGHDCRLYTDRAVLAGRGKSPPDVFPRTKTSGFHGSCARVSEKACGFPGSAKPALYAAAGIADCWVVDLVSRAVIVFREPRSGGYESRSTHRGDQLVRPLAQPEAVLSPAELFLPG